jgi:hypothetical protein
MIVAKAVAGVPTCTERLRGRTDAERDCPQLGAANSRERTGIAHRACGSFLDIYASFPNTSLPMARDQQGPDTVVAFTGAGPRGAGAPVKSSRIVSGPFRSRVLALS